MLNHGNRLHWYFLFTDYAIVVHPFVETKKKNYAESWPDEFGISHTEAWTCLSKQKFHRRTLVNSPFLLSVHPALFLPLRCSPRSFIPTWVRSLCLTQWVAVWRLYFLFPQCGVGLPVKEVNSHRTPFVFAEHSERRLAPSKLATCENRPFGSPLPLSLLFLAVQKDRQHLE